MTDRRVVSYGGGVQSNALLVLAAQNRIPHRTFIFSNVGDDSEHPDTLDYVRDIAAPFAAEHDITLVTLDRRKRDGTIETLYGRLTKPGRSIPIPMRMSGNGAPGTRNCTANFKIRVIARWLRDNLAASPDDPVRVALGISVDEIHRAHPGVDPKNPEQIREYPLLDLGLRRTDCQQLIAAAGLPVPPKSACYFCPFHNTEQWRVLARNRPDLFDKAADLESLLNTRRKQLGRDPMWMHRKLIPLRDAIDTDQTAFDFESTECEEGFCFT